MSGTYRICIHNAYSFVHISATFHIKGIRGIVTRTSNDARVEMDVIFRVEKINRFGESFIPLKYGKVLP